MSCCTDDDVVLCVAMILASSGTPRKRERYTQSQFDPHRRSRRGHAFLCIKVVTLLLLRVNKSLHATSGGDRTRGGKRLYNFGGRRKFMWAPNNPYHLGRLDQIECCHVSSCSLSYLLSHYERREGGKAFLRINADRQTD